MASTTQRAAGSPLAPPGATDPAGLTPLAVIARLSESAIGCRDLAPLVDLTTELVRRVLDTDFVEIRLGSRPDGRIDEPVRWPDHGVDGGVSIEIPGSSGPIGMLVARAQPNHSFDPDDTDFLRSVAGVLGGAAASCETGSWTENEEITHQRLVQYHAALARFAQSLLANAEDDPLARAVEALPSATSAGSVFVERNVTDPDLGFCSRTVATAQQPDELGHHEIAAHWEIVSWERMPTTRADLEQGKQVTLTPSTLVGPEYEVYAEDPVMIVSEIDVPIFVNGEWAGLIGLAERRVDREWTSEDRSLLAAAATMIGAYWESDTARAALLELVRSKDMALASVSHELRAPLATVVGTSQLLRDPSLDLSPEERAALLDSVVSEGTDLANIVNDLLAAAKADSGTLTVSRVRVSLRAQAAQVLEAIQQDTETGVAMLAGSVTAVGDPGRVRQIVRNLVSNALRYGGDTIRVELDRNGGSAILRVCDNGTGIPADDQQRIFEAYESAHGVPGRAGSVGLGLAISRRLARLMDGDLTYRFDDGESIFEFSLPEAD